MKPWRTLWLVPCALFALACNKPQGGPAAVTVTEEKCPAGPRPISVSLVNSWPLHDPEQYATDQERDCASLVYYEMLPWTDRSGPCDKDHPSLCTNAYRAERQQHLRAMSAHKVKSLWSPENLNAEGPKRWTDDQFRQHIRDFRADAEAVGLEWVALSTGGEPWAWDYKHAETRAKIVDEEWPGELVVPDAGRNEATGTPYFPGFSYSWLEVHPCSFPQLERSLRTLGPILTVTDCGPVLVPGEPVKTDLTAEAARLNVPLLFYGFTMGFDG